MVRTSNPPSRYSRAQRDVVMPQRVSPSLSQDLELFMFHVQVNAPQQFFCAKTGG